MIMKEMTPSPTNQCVSITYFIKFRTYRMHSHNLSNKFYIAIFNISYVLYH